MASIAYFAALVFMFRYLSCDKKYKPSGCVIHVESNETETQLSVVGHVGPKSKVNARIPLSVPILLGTLLVLSCLTESYCIEIPISALTDCV